MVKMSYGEHINIRGFAYNIILINSEMEYKGVFFLVDVIVLFVLLNNVELVCSYSALYMSENVSIFQNISYTIVTTLF
jgi:hypothetical protein